jgi:hypothetical protein
VKVQGALHAIEALRPALLAPYRDLAALRYDFPVVLFRQPADTPFESLSNVIDGVIAKIGEGGDRERVRKVLVRQEHAIRNLVAAGTTGPLAKLWSLAQVSAEESSAETLAKARALLDGESRIVDCDASMPARLLIRAWRFSQQRKTAAMRAELERLVLKVSDILRADPCAAETAREPRLLQASVGKTFEDAFDFERLSAILSKTPAACGLSESRRRRLEEALAALESQHFFRALEHEHEDGAYVFLHTSCAAVVQAYRERMPKMIELARAMAIARLEIKGEYREALHDPLFDAYGANGLAAEELAQFPDYLLWLTAPSTEDFGELMALLAANLPVKVLVPFDDLLEESAAGGQLTLSLRSKQLADLAIGLGTVYVLQSSASSLVQMKSALLKGLSYAGPAVFSVYSGAQPATGLPPYLLAAAATESRAFPTFTYDPAAGPDWAARFSLEANPQAEHDWPVQSFVYENEKHERVECELEFTLADFMACDPRYSRHFAKVPAADCNGNMLTVRDWLRRNAGASSEDVPALMMVDPSDLLQRVVVDAKAIEEARRCRSVWRSLQELGGINNSHAERLLARERAAWEEQKKREIEALLRDAKPAAGAVADGSAAAASNEAAPTPAIKPEAAAPAEKGTDEAYIETPRCTTCEECVRLNDKMFAYDGNKQAYIADLNAGTYRQLVEAAEACQVSIIHPGKPRNPAEPGVEELLERAQAFN